MLQSTKEMRKLFGKDKEALGKTLEGYLYCKWPSVFIYHVRSRAARYVPDPEVVPRYPEENVPPEIDELIQLTVEKSMYSLLSTETSPYHGKVIRRNEAEALLTVEEDISLTNLEKVIPYKLARDIILKNPDRIAVIDCPCRASKEHPCEPRDVCLVVGEPFVGFIMEHHTNNARQVSQAEAVAIMKAEDDRGHVHSAWFRESCGDRFIAVCNCCRCCCNGMRGHFHHVPIIATSGYVAQISATCNGCEACIGYCQFGAITMNGRAVVNAEKCMGCGVCESKCPQDAISLYREPARCEPLDIRVLRQQAVTS